ncbi:MAG: hypothetical protein JNM17_18255 [Archangium sp.]|nr:hypothetical protein [Archangium sp.]
MSQQSKRIALLLLSLLGTVVVAWWYARQNERLLLGTTQQEELVPWWYQASAFPAYFLLLGELVIEPTDRARRIALVIIVSAIAIVRVKGLIPLSGHATFLVAAAVFSWKRSHFVVVAALLGMVMTTTYKIIWHDYLWGSLSVLIGGLIGLATRPRPTIV